MRMVGFKSRQTTQSHCRAKCFQFYLAFIIFALRVLGISGYYRGLSPSSYFILQLCNVVIFAQAPNWSLMPPTDANASRVFAQLALWFHCIADGENNLISKSTSLTIHGNSWFYTINQLALISKLGIWRFAQRIKLGGRRGSHIKHARAFVYQLCRQDWCSACYGGNVLCAAQISVMEANEGFLTTVSPIPHNLTAAPHFGKLCNCNRSIVTQPIPLA